MMMENIYFSSSSQEKLVLKSASGQINRSVMILDSSYLDSLIQVIFRFWRPRCRDGIKMNTL